MAGIWAKGLSDQLNSSVAFYLTFDHVEQGELTIAGGSCFQIYADGTLIGFGPCRAAHHYSRLQKYSFNAKTLCVIMSGYNIKTFWLLDEPPFFYCEGKTSSICFTHDDFNCCHLNDRVQRVQRFSYQRTFLESYRFTEGKREKLFKGECLYPKLSTEPSKNTNTFLPVYTSMPLLEEFDFCQVIEQGFANIDASIKPWRERAHYNESYTNTSKEVYDISEWEDFATDEASTFTYNAQSGKGKYTVLDFSRAITGFFKMQVKAKSDAQIYVIYDELIWDEEKATEYKNIGFYRNACSNVFKFTVEKGTYNICTLEPYAIRYAKIVIFGDADVTKASIIDYSNPDVRRFKFNVSDQGAQDILQSAVHTFAQNAVDLLTDCPSRERAGWLSDSYFSSVAERLFTGKNIVEESFLENYALFSEKKIPVGMVPMCYPADNYDEAFIPNWAMWYILEVCKYARLYGKNKTVLQAEKNILGIVKYFDGLTNELGLLEDLEKWVFIEWSEANNPTHTTGVNVATNFCWAKCLMEIGELFSLPQMTEKGELIKRNMLDLAFDGEFFVDNLVRKDGKLVQTGLLTEVCQYYAFWFKIATKESHPALYHELMENLGVKRAEGYKPHIAKPNAMYGIYMRLDLLEREGKIELLYEECNAYFLKMARRTGTLWEHNDISASTIHGFAAYAAKWIVYALTGYLNGEFSDGFIGKDCSFVLPQPSGKSITVCVKDGKRTIGELESV